MRNNLLLIGFGSIFLLFMSSYYMQNDPWPVPSKYQKLKNPYADADDSQDQIGKELYYIHCKSCHGKKGIGDGSKAAELGTPVPDLTIAEFKSQTDGEIYFKTFVGRDEMPSFEKKIKDEEDRWMVVNYMRAIAE